VVMPAKAYADWLTTNGAGNTLADQGKTLFIRYGCHLGGGTVRAPSLAGLYGSPVPLSDGSTVIADDRYIRDSIMYPKQQIVASYEPIMPSFANVIPEDDLVRLVAYIHSLAAEHHG
jgi:cytochrome c oxidase subunit II